MDTRTETPQQIAARVLEYTDRHPDLHDQRDWYHYMPDGTTMAIFPAGQVPDPSSGDTMSVEAIAVHLDGWDLHPYSRAKKDGQLLPIRQVAARLLGLAPYQAEQLISASDEAAMDLIREIAKTPTP
jgi:hypothetical protein